MPDTLKTSTGRQGQVTREFLARLEAREDLARSFYRMRLHEVRENVKGDLEAILARIAAAREAGEDLSPSWLYRERRYRTLMRRVLDEMQTFGTARELIQEQKAALELGRAYARQSMQTAGVDALLGDMDEDVARTIIAGTDYGTPLDALLAEVAGDTATAARAALVTGVSTGKGIPWIRRRFDQAMDIPRWRIDTIARTESQRAFRAATQASFQENAEHLTGWVWTAALDSRTCPACLVMHGTTHALSETLDGHPNCRCVMVPRTPDWDDILGPDSDLPDTRPTIQTGKEWLEEQSEAVQRGVLGPGKWKAWKDGAISLDDLVHQSVSPSWGTMRREATLAEALGRGTHRQAVAEAVDKDVPEVYRDRVPLNARRRWDAPTQSLELGDLPFWSSLGRMDDVPAEVIAARKATAREDGLYDFSWTPLSRTERMEDWVDLLMEIPLAEVAGQGTFRTERAVRVAAQKVYVWRARREGVLDPWDPDLDAPEAMEDAVLAVNPNYTRPNARDEGWQTNCTRCTMSYEARRRGLRAKAQPLPSGEEWGLYRQSVEVAWTDDLEGIYQTTQQTWDEADKAMLAEGEGARGAITTAWKGGGAHIWNWEVKDGEVVWVDAQTSQILSPSEKFSRKLRGTDPRWVRLDDKPLTQGVRSMLDLEG